MNPKPSGNFRRRWWELWKEPRPTIVIERLRITGRFSASERGWYKSPPHLVFVGDTEAEAVAALVAEQPHLKDAAIVHRW